jgi:PEP-CTERM motif
MALQARMRRDHLDRRNGSMHRLLSLSAVITSAILATVGVAHAGGGAAIVPEPSSLAVLGIGAAALAWWQRGRRK